MTPAQRGWLFLLLVVAAVSGWWLWSLNRDDDTPPLTGPPRSDYSLENFQLIAMDEQAGGRTGRQERIVEAVGWRGD